MESKTTFTVILILSIIFSFGAIFGDLPFIAPENHSMYIAGRIAWGFLHCVWLILLVFNLVSIKKLVVFFLITMMFYSFHGQWFMPGYFLGFAEMVLVVGLFFPVEKNTYRTIVITSCIIMCYLVLYSPATYNSQNELINNKFRIDAIIAVILISIGSILGHTYVTLKRQEKDEAYRKFLDIGKYSSFLFHDFKGLLSTPIFYADMLTQTLKTGASTQEVVERLNEDLAFIQDYSKEIMKLTLPDNKTYDVTSKINIEEITKTLNILLRKPLSGVKFSIIVNGIPDRQVNGYKLVKVFYNSILNSLESLKNTQVPNPEITITFEKNKIQIKDNGIGFPNEILKKINQDEVMVSTKENGSGIGTAIIKDLVKNMDGKINFYNDNGAVVNINF